MSTLLTLSDFLTAVSNCPFAPKGVTYQAVPFVPGVNGIPAIAVADPSAFTILRTQNGVTTTRWAKVYWQQGYGGTGPDDANPNGSGVLIEAYGGAKAVSDAGAFLLTLT